MSDWLAVWQHQPWGPERDDLRAAATLACFGGDEATTMQYPYRLQTPEELTEENYQALIELHRPDLAAEAHHNGNGCKD